MWRRRTCGKQGIEAEGKFGLLTPRGVPPMIVVFTIGESGMVEGDVQSGLQASKHHPIENLRNSMALLNQEAGEGQSMVAFFTRLSSGQSDGVFPEKGAFSVLSHAFVHGVVEKRNEASQRQLATSAQGPVAGGSVDEQIAVSDVSERERPEVVRSAMKAFTVGLFEVMKLMPFVYFTLEGSSWVAGGSGDGIILQRAKVPPQTKGSPPESITAGDVVDQRLHQRVSYVQFDFSLPASVNVMSVEIVERVPEAGVPASNATSQMAMVPVRQDDE
ncbi:hypothetical protein NE237_029851 [Protea cynaroides]|uniref:Uncharacterized protein n=1 Tax=Protea cynaroides TaxID=273540 RepID=A0A9Q0GWM5_9MAGN|nr:hypothetical protein NE237_029851 [Protea cynaroides]